MLQYDKGYEYMNAKIITKSLLTLIVLLIFASCCLKGADVKSNNSNSNTIESGAQEIKRKAQEYLQPLLHVGESPADLVGRFGDPAQKWKSQATKCV
jgi:hypothetical protein